MMAMGRNDYGWVMKSGVSGQSSSARSIARNLVRLGITGTVALLLAGCATRGGPIPYDASILSVPDRPAPEDAAYDIPLGPLDVIHVTVFRIPDLSGDYQVDAHGLVALPLIGSVSVRDQSPAGFATSLERLYSARYLNNPDITVRVVTSNGSNITIEGGVSAPGIYALPGKTTLLGAIALAHGLDQDNANPRRVVIFRKQQGKTVAAAFDLISIHEDKMQDPLVYPGDTVIIESNNLSKLYRDLVQSLPAVAIFNQL
jgi:polysaccharide export outer membrane protein